MCALEDSISDLAAVDAPSRVLMTLGFAAYVIWEGPQPGRFAGSSASQLYLLSLSMPPSRSG